jgi:hypothetical protein
MGSSCFLCCANHQASEPWRLTAILEAVIKRAKLFLFFLLTDSYALQINSQSVPAGYVSGAWQIIYCFLHRLSLL